MKSRLRYIVPNAFTAGSIGMGLLAIENAIAGHPRNAVWWALYCTLTDKLDGTVARRLNATSAFGMQLDSLADFLCFGVVPATVSYAFLSTHPEVGWSSGPMLWLLRALLFGYVLCAAARLARFNVTTDLGGGDKLFFGIPTTLAGALSGAFFALFLKYGNPAWTAAEPGYDWRLLHGLRADEAMRALPFLMAFFGYLMVSRLRVPKMGRIANPALNRFVLASVVVLWIFGLLRMLPECMVSAGMLYILGSTWFHFTSEKAKAARLPPLFS